MSSSRSMVRRIAVFAAALSLGSLPLASAAIPGLWQESTIHQIDPVRTFMRTLTDVLSPVDKCGRPKGNHPGNRPGSGTSEAKPEGSGVCPNGKPGPQGNPNQTGN